MSYTLYLELPRLDGTIRGEALREIEDAVFAPVDTVKEATKLRVGTALAAQFPDFEVERFGYDHTSRSQSRYFEINDLGDDSFGVQIQLFDDEASLTIPFWHEGAKAEACFAQVWDIIGVICRETGYAVFDPQMDRTLNKGENFDAALQTYAKLVRKVSRDPDLGGRKPAKPWWKKKR
jgi:hypothetical protein